MSETAPVKVGDLLVVEPCNYTRKPIEPVEVVVTKAARIWLEMTKVGESPNYGNTWRMRRDTQNSGDTKYSQHNSYFFTPEQFARRQQAQVCAKILRDHGIQIELRSPHHRDESFLIDLASWLEAWHHER